MPVKNPDRSARVNEPRRLLSYRSKEIGWADGCSAVKESKQRQCRGLFAERVCQPETSVPPSSAILTVRAGQGRVRSSPAECGLGALAEAVGKILAGRL